MLEDCGRAIFRSKARMSILLRNATTRAGAGRTLATETRPKPKLSRATGGTMSNDCHRPSRTSWLVIATSIHMVLYGVKNPYNRRLFYNCDRHIFWRTCRHVSRSQCVQKQFTVCGRFRFLSIIRIWSRAYVSHSLHPDRLQQLR